jgi:hypothetical protein
MLVQSLIRSISGLKEAGSEIACKRGSLRIQRYEDGQTKFSFVGRTETIEFFIGISDLIQLALGDTLLVSGPECTLTMSRTSRCVQMVVQRQDAKPVEFEMPLDKLGELLTSMVEGKRPIPETAPVVYLN